MVQSTYIFSTFKRPGFKTIGSDFILYSMSQAHTDRRRYKNQGNQTLCLLRKSKKDYLAQLSSNDSKNSGKPLANFLKREVHCCTIKIYNQNSTQDKMYNR